MQSGNIDPVNKTIDLHDVAETETSILLTDSQLSLTWRNAAGELIRLTKAVDNVDRQLTYVKTITNPTLVSVGSKLQPSAGGYLVPSKRGDAAARSLVNIDWTNLSDYTTDGTGAMIPVNLSH